MNAASSEAKQITDPDTGHAVWCCTSVGNNASFYFHDRGWSRDSRWLYFHSYRPTDDDNAGEKMKLFRLRPPDGAPERVPGTRFGTRYVLSPAGRAIFEETPTGIFRIDTGTGDRGQLAELAPAFQSQGISVSCDGRMVARATCTYPSKKESEFPDWSAYWWEYAFTPHVRQCHLDLFDAATGASRELMCGRDWYGHVQWSPTDPNLLSFCHEGNWCLVQRMWLIHADGHSLRQVHPTRIRHEGIGHEFFSTDGKYIWGHGYRLHNPYESGRPLFDEADWFIFRQSIEDPKDYVEWPEVKRSVHWNNGASADWIVGDGSEYPGAVGIWRAWAAPDARNLDFEMLVSLEGHEFKGGHKRTGYFSPNAQVSPDGKWLSYTSSQFTGSPQVCVAEL